jgi:HAD superfamily phosphoserine phosphatase-like hydrolase
MSVGPAVIDVYDFDNTIYNGDASRDFLLFCMRTQPGAWRDLPRQAWATSLFAARALSRDRFKERAFGILKRLPSPGSVVEDFWTRHRSKVAPWYLAQHQPSDVIVSASPEFLLAPLTAELGIKTLIGTRMDPATGALDGPNCRGEEKVRRLRAAGINETIDRAYSDSLSDLPLLRLARRPYIVRRGVAIPLADFQRR